MTDKCHDSCCHSTATCIQSLDEIEFERGIWQAALDGNQNKVKSLLSKGVGINIQDSSGYTALHYASRNGHEAVVRFLIEHGACVNCKTKSGEDTPLHRASYAGYVNIVKVLINAGSILDSTNIDGQTCLHRAAAGKQSEVIKYLLKINPSLENVKDSKGRLALDLL